MTEPADIKLVRPLDKLHIVTVLPADLSQVNTVGAVLSANDDHRITVGSEAGCLFLPRKRSKTYCITNI